MHTISSTKPGGIKHLLVFSLPVILSQACESLMMFTDRYLLSLQDPISPSAAQVGGMTAFLLWIFGFGLLGYITPLVAQYTGAKQPEKARGLVPQALFLAALLSLPIFFFGDAIGVFYFQFLKIPTEEYSLAMQYFSLILKACLFVFIKVTFASYFSGIGQTRTVMLVNGLGLIVNVPLSYAFIFGALGPSWSGIRGAALGTLIAEFFMACAFSVLFFKNYAKGTPWRLRRDLLSKILLYGTPAGLEFLILTFAFSTFLAMFHSYGLAEAQAITVVMNWNWLTVLPFVGLSIGISSLVGHALGEGNVALAKTITKSGLWIVVYVVAIASMGFLFFSEAMSQVFTGGQTLADKSLALTMLRTLPLYCFLDATSFVYSATLRAAGATRYCLVVGWIAHWLCMFVSFYGIFYGNFPPLLIWSLLLGTLFCQASALGIRYWQGGWQRLKIIDS